MASALGGLSEGGKNVLGGPVEIRERAGRLQHSGKFIAADAKRRVWCNRGSNPLTRNLQETVAGIMAESVVHHLPIVQIDDDQSPITRSAAVERAQRDVDRSAIGNRRQRDRTSGVVGKSVVVRGDHGGRRLMTTKQSPTQ